ncbi:MAG: glycosyltransferase family 9 protein [Vicinamibacteria bacterium]
MRIDFQRRVDRLVGVPVCRLLSLLPRATDRAHLAPPPRKILVILLSEMGSLVLAQPMFARLHKKYPDASLHALVFQQNKEVLDLLEAVPEENVFTIRNGSLSALMKDALGAVRSLRRRGIDTVIDCELFSRVSAILSLLTGARRRAGFDRHTQEGLYRGDFINRPVLYNPYQHIARQFLTLVEAVDGSGMPMVKRSLEEDRVAIEPLRTREGEIEAMRLRIESDFPHTRGARLVLVYPGGGLLPIRAWPLTSFQELVRGLVARGFVVGIIGLLEDRALAREIRERCGVERTIDFTGYTGTVRDLMLLFHLAELLVTNDGGPGHFAAMTPIRSIVLYGPESPVLYGSLDERSTHFYANLSCSPCLTAYNHRNSPCDGDNQCLKVIRPEDVLERAIRLLSG